MGFIRPLDGVDDSVPVGIGVVGEGNIEFVAHPDQSSHGIGRRAVHPDFSIPIGRHESKCRVDHIANDRCRDAIPLDDRLPKVDARAAQRIDPDLHPRRADRLHVDNIREVSDIRANVVVAMDKGRFACSIVRDPSKPLRSF